MIDRLWHPFLWDITVELLVLVCPFQYQVHREPKYDYKLRIGQLSLSNECFFYFMSFCPRQFYQNIRMDNSKKFQCEDCNKFYSSKMTLYVHKKSYCPNRNTSGSIKDSRPRGGGRGRGRRSPSVYPSSPDPLAVNKLSSSSPPSRSSPSLPAYPDWDFNEDDIAYWSDFAMGKQC